MNKGGKYDNKSEERKLSCKMKSFNMKRLKMKFSHFVNVNQLIEKCMTKVAKVKVVETFDYIFAQPLI